MAQYIDKSALVAEIERRRDYYKRNPLLVNAKYCIDEDNAILKLLDTLEVKEVDFEKELDEWMKIGPHTSYPWCTIHDAIKITAVKFFELGLNSQTEDMIDALHTEYEKGRADALANALTLDQIKGMENQAFLAGIEAERNKSILKNKDSNRKKI